MTPDHHVLSPGFRIYARAFVFVSLIPFALIPFALIRLSLEIA